MKTSIKVVARLVSLLLVLPLLIADFLARQISSDGLFVFCSQLLSLMPGTFGSYLRVAYYRHAMEYCSADCYIGFGTIFSQRATRVGHGVYIGPQCNVGACTIGADSLIASGVHIMSGSEQHHFDDLHTPIREQGGVLSQISIGEDCWIGNAALIMADLGDKAVIGAGSVVTQALGSYKIAVGNPAKVLRSRLDDSKETTAITASPIQDSQKDSVQ